MKQPTYYLYLSIKLQTSHGRALFAESVLFGAYTKYSKYKQRRRIFNPTKQIRVRFMRKRKTTALSSPYYTHTPENAETAV
jgi:hypothetical protein